MRLGAWMAFVTRHRRPITLLAVMTTFAGVALLIDRPKGTIIGWFSLPLVVVGGAIFAWGVWPHGATSPKSSQSVASHLLSRLTWHGRLVPLFPVFGVAIVLADLGYNLALSGTPALLTEDTIVLLAAATLLGYNFVPARFARERDFVLLFFLSLNAILVVPLLAARAYYANFESSVDVYSWVALAPETSAVLSVLGVANSVHAVSGSTAPGLTFTPQRFPVRVTVVITTACSGIYSFGIFASAFLAFVLTEYERPSRKMWLLVGLGLLTAYVANVLRMVAVVLVGYYTDTTQTDLQNMLIAHSYAGWLIFMGWIALFWSLVFRILPRYSTQDRDLALEVSTRRRKNICRICSIPLTPIVPAIGCSCGAHFHRTCALTTGRCPACKTIWAFSNLEVTRGI